MAAPRFDIAGVRHMQLVACSQLGLYTEVVSWCGLASVTQKKTPLIILDGNLNAHRYTHEILIPVAVPL